jgi:hypothetical protein
VNNGGYRHLVAVAPGNTSSLASNAPLIPARFQETIVLNVLSVSTPAVFIFFI